jgi:hypothetical protein
VLPVAPQFLAVGDDCDLKDYPNPSVIPAPTATAPAAILVPAKTTSPIFLAPFVTAVLTDVGFGAARIEAERIKVKHCIVVGESCFTAATYLPTKQRGKLRLK